MPRRVNIIALGGFVIFTGAAKLALNPADPWLSLALMAVGFALVAQGWLRNRKKPDA